MSKIFYIIVFVFFNNINWSESFETEFGYTINVPYFSTIKENISKDSYGNEYETINIKNYQVLFNDYSLYDNLKRFKKYKYNNKEYYYNKQDDYTIEVYSDDKTLIQNIELNIIKGNKYERLIEDEKYQKLKDSNKMRLAWIKDDSSGLVNVYKNIYKYNIDTIQFYDVEKSRQRTNPYYYNLTDLFKYNHMTIDEFISHYEKIVKLNYGQKEVGKNYILYKPVEKRLSGEMYYSILVCNNKYIFGLSDLKYSKNLCK